MRTGRQRSRDHQLGPPPSCYPGHSRPQNIGACGSGWQGDIDRGVGVGCKLHCNRNAGLLPLDVIFPGRGGEMLSPLGLGDQEFRFILNLCAKQLSVTIRLRTV